MGTGSNPSGNQEAANGGGGGGAANPSNGNDVAAAAAGSCSSTAQALKHNPGLSTEWSSEEQAILEEGISKYSSESILVRYAKVAQQLNGKTVRDVALRCRWMSKKESGKRRKDDHNLSRKNKDKKERVTDPSAKPSAQSGVRPIGPLYPLSALPTETDDEISYQEIGGSTGRILETNSQIFNQVTSNLAKLQIQENISLFCQARDNIISILNDMSDSPGVMKQMPPLPVKINEELANSIL
ncbi:Uncharacterized protein M6B38_112550 [Iris pallida]|uniref:Myb-like domain-containing protein n=1 Tax=Iris pallida TaxID=29817 RepID=A0AAX6DMW9_IRIPA|nr:Uncharacterized protein M6B38_112550 [Iris pallida]